MDIRIWPKEASAIFLLAALTVMGSPAQTFSVLVDFDGTNGGEPQYVTLIQGRDGSFYGTAFLGGYHECSIPEIGRSTCGLVFKMTPTGGANNNAQVRLHRWWISGCRAGGSRRWVLLRDNRGWRDVGQAKQPGHNLQNEPARRGDDAPDFRRDGRELPY